MEKTPRADVEPPLFKVVGWSWLVMGALGVAFGALGLLGAASLRDASGLLAQMPAEIPRETVEPLIKSLSSSLLPATLIQLAASVFMCYGSWLFLKGSDWGRFWLELLNVFSFVCLLAILFPSFKSIGALLAIMGADVPQGALAATEVVTAAVLAAPFAWMGWYLRSPAVRRYCDGPRPG